MSPLFNLYEVTRVDGSKTYFMAKTVEKLKGRIGNLEYVEITKDCHKVGARALQNNNIDWIW